MSIVSRPELRKLERNNTRFYKNNHLGGSRAGGGAPRSHDTGGEAVGLREGDGNHEICDRSRKRGAGVWLVRLLPTAAFCAVQMGISFYVCAFF